MRTRWGKGSGSKNPKLLRMSYLEAPLTIKKGTDLLVSDEVELVEEGVVLRQVLVPPAGGGGRPRGGADDRREAPLLPEYRADIEYRVFNSGKTTFAQGHKSWPKS